MKTNFFCKVYLLFGRYDILLRVSLFIKEGHPVFTYLSGEQLPLVAFIGVMFAFVATCFFIGKFNQYLPKDIGREFAHDGKLSAGKPRGAGFIFVMVFLASSLVFAYIDVEILIYLVLVFAAMMTGFLDDAAKIHGESIRRDS